MSLPSGTFGTAILTSSLACLVTLVGIYVIRKYETWGITNIAYFMSFAAGVLISVSFIHLIPESFSMNDASPIYLLIGFMALYLINRFLNAYICQEHRTTDYTFGLIPMLGIGFHSLLDGVIYSVAFNVSVFTGVLAAIGMVLHEFPEGIVTYLLLKRSGYDRGKATWYALFAAAVSTPLGTLISYPFIRGISQPALGAAPALSAGTFVYVGASHLIPAVEKENKHYTLVSLFTGVIVAMLIVFSK